MLNEVKHPSAEILRFAQNDKQGADRLGLAMVLTGLRHFRH